jgi:hypothetical protein
MRRLSTWLVLLAALTMSLPSFSGAAMPPHVTKLRPEAGGVLRDRTIVVEKYTLQGTVRRGRLSVVDAETGKAIPFEAEGPTCHRECRGPH